MDSTKNETIPLIEPLLGNLEKDWLLRCIDSGYVSTAGPVVSEFERNFAEYTGARFAIATSSGTAAIHVALQTLGIRNGTSVIVPDLTFVASLNPVLYCGANPVLLDIDKTTWCLDVELFESVCKIMSQSNRCPSAVIPVHLYGCACDMEAIVRISQKYGLHIIEDATEALGTYYKGRQVGTCGDIGCFSFNGNKMITTGSGGMITTNSRRLAEKARYLVNQARDSSDTYVHSEMGFNYRMNSLSAALGMAQLERIDEIIQRKQTIAKNYQTAFQKISAINCHPQMPGIRNSFWLYSITMKSRRQRNFLLKNLLANGIQVRKFFEPLHTQPYINSGLWTKEKAKPEYRVRGNSNLVSGRGLNLPSSAGMTGEQQRLVIDRIIETVNAISTPCQDMPPSCLEIPVQKMAS